MRKFLRRWFQNAGRTQYESYPFNFAIFKLRYWAYTDVFCLPNCAASFTVFTLLTGLEEYLEDSTEMAKCLRRHRDVGIAMNLT